MWTVRARRACALIVTAAIVAQLATQSVLAAPVDAPSTARPTAATVNASLVVYGATPSGIMAAIAARRSGIAPVVLIEPTGHIGGMMTSTPPTGVTPPRSAASPASSSA
jgi:NADPH-dependent 2,4-dienoyl-CoA reductase/sulfur reductase-like enzyme